MNTTQCYHCGESFNDTGIYRDGKKFLMQ
jgi:hypothetical protein